MDTKQLEDEFLQGLDEDLGALGLLGEDAIPKPQRKPNRSAGMPKRATFDDFGAIEESKLYMSMTFFSFFKRLQVSSNQTVDLQNLTVTQCFLLCAIATKQIRHEESLVKSMAYNFSLPVPDLMAQLIPISDLCSESKKLYPSAKRAISTALISINAPPSEPEQMRVSLSKSGQSLMESIVSTKIFRT